MFEEGSCEQGTILHELVASFSCLGSCSQKLLRYLVCMSALFFLSAVVICHCRGQINTQSIAVLRARGPSNTISVTSESYSRIGANAAILDVSRVGEKFK